MKDTTCFEMCLLLMEKKKKNARKFIFMTLPHLILIHIPLEVPLCNVCYHRCVVFPINKIFDLIIVHM